MDIFVDFREFLRLRFQLVLRLWILLRLRFQFVFSLLIRLGPGIRFRLWFWFRLKFRLWFWPLACYQVQPVPCVVL